MPFLRRLGYFLIGLSVGLILLTFFLKKKAKETGTEFCYFPNCRVLKDLRSQPLAYSGLVNAMIKDQVLDSMDIAYFLQEGDVDFGRSNTKAEPCKHYQIKGKAKEQKGRLFVKRCQDSVIIDNFLLE